MTVQAAAAVSRPLSPRMMNGQELATAMQYDGRVVFIVINAAPLQSWQRASPSIFVRLD